MITNTTAPKIAMLLKLRETPDSALPGYTLIELATETWGTPLATKL
jgi:hypothetical protein